MTSSRGAAGRVPTRATALGLAVGGGLAPDQIGARKSRSVRKPTALRRLLVGVVVRVAIGRDLLEVAERPRVRCGLR